MTAIAAKAIIVNELNELLLQLRDQRGSTLYPGKWDLFGGGSLQFESAEETLRRELKEELGIEVFESTLAFKSERSWDGILNHVFLVKIPKNAVLSFLGEGQEKRWVLPKSLVELNTGPLIYRNLFEIGMAIGGLHSKVFEEFEKSLIKKMRLRKKSGRVYFAEDREAVFSMQDFWQLAAVVQNRGEEIFRVCLHSDQSEDIQEMIICHLRRQVVGPLSQSTGTSISFTPLEGEGVVRLYSPGKDCREVKLTATDDGVRALRVRACQARSIESTITPFIFHEVNKGPFHDSDTDWLEVAL